MAIEARNRTLPDWFTRVRTRQVALPRFQRHQAWNHGDIALLFNTILRDLPVGAALVLDVGDNTPFICRPIEGAPDDGERITENLLDGQQRLTALWRALHNNYDDRTYFLYLSPDSESGVPYFVESEARWQKEGEKQRRPFWANAPASQWRKRAIPLDLFAPDIASQQRFRTWVNDAVADQQERDCIADTVSEIRQKFASFNLPFLNLPVTTEPQVALDVFLKMNSTAAPLSTYDIVVAQVEAGTGTSLHDLVAESRKECPAIAAYYPLEDLALYSNALLQDRAPVNGTYMARDFGEILVKNWERFIRGVRRTAVFLEEQRVFDAARLPTDVVVPVLVALWADAPDGLDAEGNARQLLREYFWRASFSERYARSTGSRSLADYEVLKPLVAGRQGPTPAILDVREAPLPEAAELLHAGWPKKRDRLARAILAIALAQGGLDLADGSPVSRENLPKREYHHLFPDALLKQRGLPDEKISTALNCALVTWKTNRNIADKNPERYLAERLDGTEVSEAAVRERLASHLIPYEELRAGDYEAFLGARARWIHEKMAAVCGAARTKAAPAGA